MYSHHNLKTSLGHAKYCYFSFHQNIWILVVLQHKWLVQSIAFPHLKKIYTPFHSHHMASICFMPTLFKAKTYHNSSGQ